LTGPGSPAQPAQPSAGKRAKRCAPAFTDTKLVLDQTNEVPPKTISVPDLTGTGTADKPFFTDSEPMFFRKKGDGGGGIPLMVTVNPVHPEKARAAPATVQKLGTVGIELQARRMTKRDRARVYGRAEVVLAGIAILLALFTFLASLWAPSADEKVGRAALAAQLQPIEQRLTIGISTHDSVAIQQSQAQLEAVLQTQDRRSNPLSTAAKWTSFLLALISAVITYRVATKRAKATPS
jgi:hypothetical protein